MGEKLVELQRDLQSEGFNAFLITNVTNVYYFTKFLSRSYAYYVVYPENQPFLFVPELEYEDAMRNAINSEVIKIERNEEILQVLKQNLENNQVKVLGIEENSMRVKFYLDMSEKCKFLELKNGSKLIDKLRMTKTMEEIEKIKTACRIADLGLATAIKNIEEGKTEIEVVIEAEYAMRKNGSETIPFDTIIASGYRSALPHGVSSNKKIKRGDLIIIDIGAKYDGYCSDMTRTVVLGEASQKQLDIFNAVLKTQQEAIKFCKVGVEAISIEEEARNILIKEGFDEYFVHSLGHGVGLEVHESPYLALKTRDILQENSIFTIEPGVYIPDFGGVRIEDMVLLTKKGAECLTKSEYKISI